MIFINKIYMQINQIINNFFNKYRNIIEKIQLTLFYIFSVLLLVDFAKETLNNQYFWLQKYINLSKWTSFKFFKFFNLSERSIFLNIFCHELFIRRDIFNTSNLVKFNVILFCMITMLNSLFITYWNLCFIKNSNELSFAKSKSMIQLNDNMHFTIFGITLIVFTYVYLCGLMKKKPTGPNFLKPVIEAASFAINKKRIRNQHKEQENI
jgi:hypothetical protein